ncbi:putative methyltransferase YcgJ [Alicyclobacillus contaminans]|uniref:class I SAM-dependent methyltransferase n=1 Tax=Alicyclobacillus contaminans TaxID=392016 RepID=UPI00041765C4|nr:class I SAM-dependent methyltransferase [Alicyclobacillus contaminans]GMA49746.1 putative methyltransferase YcgJ [Alicyclobacillus contaminans]
MESARKDSVRRQFSQNAGDYRDEPVFAEGEDLRRMVESVALHGTETLLDVGAGAGHTALAFAPHVRECVGCDLTEQMVDVANQFARQKQIENVRFVVGDAEDLHFKDASFDLVTCRFAAHHFPAVSKALAEISRVLKPGGTFLLVDHYAPEDDELDAFVNTLDRMRDPSHVREHRLSEYRDWFLEVGLSYREVSRWDIRLAFDNWVQRARTPLPMRQRLVEHLQSASPACKETFSVTLDDAGLPVSFCLKCALIHGVKGA